MTSSKTLALALSLLLLLIMGSMHQSYASHVADHAHDHTAASHSTGVCAWMCAAAHTISGDTPHLIHRFQLLARVESPKPPVLSLVYFSLVPARAPPR